MRSRAAGERSWSTAAPAGSTAGAGASPSRWRGPAERPPEWTPNGAPPPPGPTPPRLVRERRELDLPDRRRDDSIKAQAGDFEFLFTQARLALDAYGDRVRLAAPGEVLPDIEMIALPGHTPGHSGFHLTSGPDALLLWADIVHFPDIQIAKPNVTVGFDVDPDAARATRMKALDRVASDKLAVAGMHFNMPGFLTIERDGPGYRKVDLPWTSALL